MLWHGQAHGLHACARGTHPCSSKIWRKASAAMPSTPRPATRQGRKLATDASRVGRGGAPHALSRVGRAWRRRRTVGGHVAGHGVCLARARLTHGKNSHVVAGRQPLHCGADARLLIELLGGARGPACTRWADPWFGPEHEWRRARLGSVSAVRQERAPACPKTCEKLKARGARPADPIPVEPPICTVFFFSSSTRSEGLSTPSSALRNGLRAGGCVLSGGGHSQPGLKGAVVWWEHPRTWA